MGAGRQVTETMSSLFPDTDPQAEAILVEGYRRMPGWQKLQQVAALNHAAQQMAVARIRAQYPRAGEREVQLRLASLWLDRATMIQAFNWDPEAEGY